ncbi:MAG: hypothetical protein COZ43_00350 [Sphingomonadales bacterium CG_4_10_14_3_um_filter_58_15]|nr:MAG: hypothetical protein COZ43_00350 [Sphingomonadales bacterium CG_4_10_14_3_um_filter_58_15]
MFCRNGFGSEKDAVQWKQGERDESARRMTDHIAVDEKMLLAVQAAQARLVSLAQSPVQRIFTESF